MSREPSVGNEARRSATISRRTQKALTSSAGGTAAGVVLGALAYFLGAAYLRGGAAGAKSWLAAKFVNKPTGTSTSVPTSAVSSAKSASGTSSTTTGLVVPSSQGQPSAVLV
jgi:hypothetical protein